MKEEVDSLISECMKNADFIMGKAVKDFEKELASYVNMKYAISCGSGTDALQLIYMAYGIGSGDAVFCPDMTFIASIEPACLLGATPVFCEIDPVSYNILPESLERQIERVLEEGKLKPRAIVAVDFLGNPADYDKLRPIADKYGLFLIEDAAQAIGSQYHGKMCGSLGDIAATSFFPSKPLGCYGDGGAVFTNDDRIASIIDSLRVHGKGTSKYDNIRIGMNSRLDTMQANILQVKLRYLPKEMQLRQQKASRYHELLDGVVKTPVIENDNLSSFAQYVIMLDENVDRDAFMKALKDEGIPSIIYYPKPMHRLPVFEGIETYGESFVTTDNYSKLNVGIPFSAYVSDEEQKHVASVIRKILQCGG